MAARFKATPTTPPPQFFDAGAKADDIRVRISYRIIDLFSQGLYRSPTKAVEELVSNAFDAGATKVHVQMSPGLAADDATIAVIDNGTGMDAAGLKQHWLIGISNKRAPRKHFALGRKQIGRFGIGKLATYVLAQRLTHITKCNGKYYSTSMDYKRIPVGDEGGIYTEKAVKLALRELTETQAKEALAPWLKGTKPAYTELRLFGPKAEKTWTVAIMSSLKSMAREMQRGRLRWVLATAMPLRDDFQLYVDGDHVKPSKLGGRKLKQWILGKTLSTLPKPAPDNIEQSEDDIQDIKSPIRFGLTHPQLGRITGYAELYEDLLTGGKSADSGRSHGFFVYVRDRLINIDDEYFGIDSNLLRHGTFARFRMVLHVDALDEELRSSRESLREGPLLEITRNVLHGAFNAARSYHEQHEAKEAPGVQATQRIASSPGSLTRLPLIALATKTLAGKYTARYTDVPSNLSAKGRKEFVEELEAKAQTPEGIVRSIEVVDHLPQYAGIAKLDLQTGVLAINSLHPYVAHFLDEYGHRPKNVPLELLAISEVLTEAFLLQLGMDRRFVHDVLAERDELFRHLARASGQRNARIVAQSLLDTATNQSALETELAAAFDTIGFDGAVRIGGKGKPDGFAEAKLSASDPGSVQSYKLTLEAKSKEKAGTKVTAKSVGVSGIARQRDDYNADYAVVVGPDFPTTKGEESALGKEIQADRQSNPNKGITLIRIEDMARLVRLVPAKRVGLDRLRKLFETCSLPDESHAWIESLAKEKMERPRYRELLDAIAAEQADMPGQPVEYGSVETRLRTTKNIKLGKPEVVELCKALSKMAPGYVNARDATVELTQRTDIILSTITSLIREYPEDEQAEIRVEGK